MAKNNPATRDTSSHELMFGFDQFDVEWHPPSAQEPRLS